MHIDVHMFCDYYVHFTIKKKSISLELIIIIVLCDLFDLRLFLNIMNKTTRSKLNL